MAPPLAFLLVWAAASSDTLRDDIDRALELARSSILSGHELSEGTLGEAALGALAALRAGASPDHPTVARTLARVFTDVRAATEDDYVGTYHAAILLMLLEELGSDRTKWTPPGAIEFLTERLLGLQDPSGGWGDVSRTGFAACGLDAAERLGARIGLEPWRRLAGHLRRLQTPDGGWGYRGDGRAATGSMTAEAFASLVCAGLDPRSSELRRATAWLAERFRTDSNPGDPQGQMHRFYYLAALASCARVCGGFQEAEWARRAASALLQEMAPNGTWSGHAQDCPTAFAALFLAEARAEFARLDRPVRIPIVAIEPGRRSLEPAALRTMELALLRWTGTAPELELWRLSRGSLASAREPLRRAALAILLADTTRSIGEGDMYELKSFIQEGGFLVVEGAPGSSEAELQALAITLAPLPKGRLDWNSMPLRGPAPPGATDPPILLATCAEDDKPAVVIAPEGLFSVLGDPGLGVRSGVARAAVNILAYSASR